MTEPGGKARNEAENEGVRYPAPSLLIFDCDGVLIDSETLACQAIADELADWGLAFEGAEIARRFAGYTDRQIAELVTAERGRPLPDDFPNRVQERALTAFETALAPLPGMGALLAGSELPRCVASNSGRRRLLRALEIVGLLPFFGAGRVFSAEQVTRSKPAPDLHLLAASALGHAAHDCLVIEDSATGVEAACRAGMQVVGFLGASHLAEEEKAAQGTRLRALGAREVFNDADQLGVWIKTL